MTDVGPPQQGIICYVQTIGVPIFTIAVYGRAGEDELQRGIEHAVALET